MFAFLRSLFHLTANPKMPTVGTAAQAPPAVALVAQPVQPLRPINHARLPKPAPVKTWLTHLRFSDGTTINLSEGDIVVFVGPNNAGKSAALAGIDRMIRNAKDRGPVLMEA